MKLIILTWTAKFIARHELFIYRVLFIMLLSRLFFLEKDGTAFLLELLGAVTILVTSITSMIHESKSFIKEAKEILLSEDN